MNITVTYLLQLLCLWVLLKYLESQTADEFLSCLCWSKGISETKSNQQSPCSKCMHQPVTPQADTCTSQAYACMYCMHGPMMSQGDACSYYTDSVVLISSQIYIYLQLLWVLFSSSRKLHRHLCCTRRCKNALFLSHYLKVF